MVVPELTIASLPYFPLLQEVMKNLYCRHTKQSVSSEYTLPGVQTQVGSPPPRSSCLATPLTFLSLSFSRLDLGGAAPPDCRGAGAL